MKRGTGWFRLSLLIGAAAVPTLARAQSRGDQEAVTPSVATGDGSAPAAPNDVIVTARKRNERLLDVPQSVSAISSDDLRKLNATEFRDYANTVPGLEFTTSGAGFNQISIRGVTTGASGSQAVGIYVDDVPYGASGSYANAGSLALDQGLFDLDHIEVLRGPQGTLYGASALGGVVKYVTVAPDTHAIGGTAQAGVSSTRFGGINYDGAAAVNLPVSDGKAAVRLGGYYSHDGGFVDDTGLGHRNVDRSRTYGARADLLLTPTDRLSIRLVGTGQNIARDGVNAVDYSFNRTPRYGDLQQKRLFAEPFNQEFRLASGTIDYRFDPFSVISVSSFQRVHTIFNLDYSGLYVPYLGLFGIPLGSVGLTNDTDTRKFVEEFRVQSNEIGFFVWQLGAFYTHESNRLHEYVTATNPNDTRAALSILDAQLPSTYEEIAGFGNATLHLTDRLRVTAGIRYARNDQTYQQIASSLVAQTLPKAASRENVTTYLANAEYKFSENSNLYLRYATGYRPGGPNAVPINPSTGQPLAPASFASDHLQSYEGGLKAQTSDRTFSIDLDGYHIDWDNPQIVTTRNGIGVIANATSGARIWGSDLTLTARPSHDMTVTGAFGFVDSRLRAADADLGGRKGERLPNVPKFTGTVTADYVASQVAFRPRIGGTLRYVSDRRASFDASPNAPQYDLGDYASVDLRAGASLGRIDAQLFARNVFDTRGQLSAITGLTLFGAPAQVSVLQPRTIGVSLSTRF